jgi:hypothetical protein
VHLGAEYAREDLLIRIAARLEKTVGGCELQALD